MPDEDETVKFLDGLCACELLMHDREAKRAAAEQRLKRLKDMKANKKKVKKKQKSRKQKAAEAAAKAKAKAEAKVDVPLKEARIKAERLGDDATFLLTMEILRIRLAQAKNASASDPKDAESRFHTCKVFLRLAKSMLSSLQGADSLVHASYYSNAATFHKAKGPAPDFYQNVLMFLAYTPTASLSLEDSIEHARDVSLAALIGEDTMNFGEVLALPIVASLKGTELEWLSLLMESLNVGDIDGFNTLVSKYQAEISKVIPLETLKQKISLAALMALVFSCPADKRCVTFAQIGERTQLSVCKIEPLVMRAFSLGLIKGKMDQVDQTVNVTWLKPRVLDEAAIVTLGQRFKDWGERIEDASKFVEDSAVELFEHNL